MKDMSCFGKSSADSGLVFKVLVKKGQHVVRGINDLSHLRWVSCVTGDAFEIQRKPVMEPKCEVCVSSPPVSGNLTASRSSMLLVWMF